MLGERGCVSLRQDGQGRPIEQVTFEQSFKGGEVTVHAFIHSLIHSSRQPASISKYFLGAVLWPWQCGRWTCARCLPGGCLPGGVSWVGVSRGLSPGHGAKAHFAHPEDSVEARAPATLVCLVPETGLPVLNRKVLGKPG